MIAAPGAARVGKDKNAFLVVHETLRLGQIGGGRAVLGSKLEAAAVLLLHDAAAAPGNFGHAIRPEMVQDLVERGLHRRKRRKLLDQPVADLDRFARLHGLAVHHGGTGMQLAVLVRVAFVKLRRKGVAQISEYVLFRRYIKIEIAPLFGRNFRKPPFHQRLAGRDELHN